MEPPRRTSGAGLQIGNGSFRALLDHTILISFSDTSSRD
jgi:hypothetical protein